MVHEFQSVCYLQDNRGGSRISEEGVQMFKRLVRLPNFKQNFLKFSMNLKKFGSREGFERTP